MEITPISVRTALMPLCYKDFHCLAGACRQNCCDGGWEITFSKKDYLKVKRSVKSEELKTVLSKGMSRLRNVDINGGYAHFKSGWEGSCAFQTEEGLCGLQLECGAEVLPEVCREYPRSSVCTSAAKELSLSPSCEAVLALLWDLPQGIDFLEEDLPKQEWVTLKVLPRMARFADIRSFCIDVIQERSMPLSRRMLMLGLLLQRLKELDWTEEGVVDAWLAWGGEQLRNPPAWLEDLPRDRLKFLTCNLRVMLDLSENHEKAKKVYHSLFAALSADGEDWERNGLSDFRIDVGRYQELEDRLEALLGHTDGFFENLMVMTAFYKTFPNPAGPEELWKSYAAICGLYSFYWFAAVLSCHQECSRERLFQVIVTVSRVLLHNAVRLEKLADEVLENGGTLDHMAILAGG